MITVSITEKGILLEGHAGHSHDGQDIVCAAVSALTCNLVNSLENLTNVKVRAETKEGFAKIDWEDMTAAGKLLIDSWFLGITAINQEYNCIMFTKSP